MLAKLDALKDSVHGLVGKAQGKAATKLVEVLHPKVHDVIDTRVDAFRDSTLEALPQQCEDGLKARSGSSSVAWLVDKALGESTDVLVAQLLDQFRPGVISATDGLSADAAETIMAKLRGWLDGSDTAIAAAAGPEAEAAAAAVQLEQLQVAEGDEADAVPEEQPRSLDIPAEEQGQGEDDAVAAATTSGRTSLRNSAMSAAAALAGGLFGLDGELPEFEAAARELVHPLFDKLKTEVWELVPGALQDVLTGLVGDADHDVDEGAVEGDEGGHGISSWMSKVSNKLQGNAGRLVDKVAAVTLDAIDGPMQDMINKLVDELEATSTAAAFREIRQKLAEYRLISAEPAT